MGRKSLKLRSPIPFLLAGAVALPSGANAIDEEKHPLQSMGPRPLATPTAISKLSLSSPIRKVATPVGAIYLDIGTTDGPKVKCIGTLISPRLVLTVRHCLTVVDPLTGEAEDIKPKAIYLLLDKLEPYTGLKVDLEVEPVDVGKSKELDFLVLRTKAPVVGPERRFPPMGSDPPLSSDLYMIHQPFGDSLTVSGRECQTTDTKLVGANFGHLCDSVPGSSGAPIFDLAFNIVGIHVAGGKKENGAPNYGLLLSSILSQSGVVRDSLRQYASHTALVPAIPTSSAGREILLADGSALSELNGDWRLLSGDEKNRSSQPLRVQAGSSDEYVLWDPSTDSIYRIPRGAGNIKRKKSGEASWTEFPKGDPS